MSRGQSKAMRQGAALSSAVDKQTADAGPEAYGARSIKTRSRRTRAQLAQLDKQIIDVLRADHPQSVRHVFYRMTDPRLPEHVEKSELGYRHVQHRIAELRRAGRLPYNWIADATRWAYTTPTYGSKSEFILDMASRYRADLWSSTDFYPEVWVESRSLAGVVSGLCRELAVPLYPAGGFASLTFTYEAAQSINRNAQGREVQVFYIGDYDPAGVLIDVSIEEELRGHLDSSIELEFTRLGITEQQIRDMDLPEKPRKAGDKRALHVRATVEAEAMPAKDMRHLLRSHIEALLPDGELAAVKVAEQSEREGLRILGMQLQNEEVAEVLARCDDEEEDPDEGEADEGGTDGLP
jgi:hypothetical protein